MPGVPCFQSPVPSPWPESPSLSPSLPDPLPRLFHTLLPSDATHIFFWRCFNDLPYPSAISSTKNDHILPLRRRKETETSFLCGRHFGSPRKFETRKQQLRIPGFVATEAVAAAATAAAAACCSALHRCTPTSLPLHPFFLSHLPSPPFSTPPTKQSTNQRDHRARRDPSPSHNSDDDDDGLLQPTSDARLRDELNDHLAHC